MTVVAIVDNSTGMLASVPVPGKGRESHTHVAKQVLQFLSHLGYAEVQLKGDNEPAMEQLLSTICNARLKHGLKTQVCPSQPYVHQSNGVVEQAIQNLRDIAVVHLEQLKDASGHSVSSTQDLLGWALMHAAFVHNTFRVQGGTTPYEKCFGVQYHGRLARFGETVMCALSTKHVRKGKPKFVKVIWLGKTLNGDLHICGTSVGVYLSSCIRRLPKEQQWAKDLLMAFKGKPWSYGTAVLGSRLVPGIEDRSQRPSAGPMPLPMPPVMPRVPVPAQLAAGAGDEAASDPPSSPEGAANNVQDPVMVSVPPVGEPQSVVQEGTVSDSTMLSELVPQAPIPMQEEGASSSGAKRPATAALAAPPLYAGEPAPVRLRIQHVVVDGEELFDLDEPFIPFDIEDDLDVRLWEPEFASNVGGSVTWDGRSEDEGPPELESSQLQDVDFQAEKIEAQRLLDMNVIQEVEHVPPKHLLLQTRYVHDWRYREVWTRRARLVSKELKVWDPSRTDVHAPSTNPSMTRLIPALVACHPEEDWCLWGIDIKDAFLTVKQRSELYIHLHQKYYRVLKCLPGQRSAGAWWAEQITEDLLQTGLKQNLSCPVAFGMEGAGCTLHVDDGFLGGRLEAGQAVIDQLKAKYKLSVTGPISTAAIGERVRFLKRIFTITEDGILMQSDPKYLTKMLKLLNLTKPRSRKVPCAPEICSPDITPALDTQRHAVYRACVGGLLYLSPDRCDIQFTVSMLARKVQNPSERDFRALKHLVEYLWATESYGVMLKWTCVGRSSLDGRNIQAPHCRVPIGTHLLEVYVDSDWAGTPDRHSMTSVRIMLNSNLVHGFVRKQGTVALSSCESELIAAVSGSSEGLYLQSIVQTLSQNACRMVVLMDNSSARLLIYKTGCSRIRHLDCRLLWVQEAVHASRFHVGACPTRLNVADIGTKVLSQARIQLLLGLLGYHDAQGSLGKVELYQQELAHKVSRVRKGSSFRRILAVVNALSLADEE